MLFPFSILSFLCLCCAPANAYWGQKRTSVGISESPVRMASLRGGSGASADDDADRRFKTIQVQVIHRHGDRSPITAMKDEEFWASTLVKPEMMEKISAGTTLKRNENDASSQNHNAQGRGPFGKLSMMGLLQMIDLGTNLRDQLVSKGDGNEYCATIQGFPHCPYVCPVGSLTADSLKVISTDFKRTIQSVLGVLVGMFPDGFQSKGDIEIDCRHTRDMIPNPQPRSTREQELLEVALAKQPHIIQREAEMKPLAIRATRALRDQLDDSAFHTPFGVGEDKEEEAETEPVLPWDQLAEVTKCLKVRDLLPEAITPEDQEAIINYTAWKWFESMKDARLCYLSMNTFCQTLISTMRDHANSPPIVLYSAHDSSLIGALCSLRLELPSLWPPYSSYLKIELIQDELAKSDDTRYFVRFVFNGDVLASKWNRESKELISLEELAHFVDTEGSEPSEYTNNE